MPTIESPRMDVANGAALASVLAAGIGAFAIGFIVILNETGVFAAPAVYEPAGGVSGRTTLAAVIWLIAWLVLHRRWNNRHIEPRGVQLLTFLLTALGVVLTLPPTWRLL